MKDTIGGANRSLMGATCIIATNGQLVQGANDFLRGQCSQRVDFFLDEGARVNGMVLGRHVERLRLMTMTCCETRGGFLVACSDRSTWSRRSRSNAPKMTFYCWCDLRLCLHGLWPSTSIQRYTACLRFFHMYILYKL